MKTVKRHINSLGVTALSSLATLLIASPSVAITINRSFISEGQTFAPNFVDETAQPVQAEGTPINTTGGGSLDNIFNAAAGLWEKIFEDNFKVNIRFGWLNLGGLQDDNRLTLGFAAPIDYLDNRDLFGNPRLPYPGEAIATDFVVVFNSNSIIPWFLDNTPPPQDLFTKGINNTTVDITRGSEEYQNFELPQDPIGLELNQLRIGSAKANSPAFDRIDLYTVALHEIGHTLGLYTTSDLPVQKSDGSPGSLGLRSGFEIETADGDIDITSPRPFAGMTFNAGSSDVDANDEVGAHLSFNGRLMSPTLIREGRGVRVLPTGVDVLSVAQVSGFKNINLRSVPEPSSVLGLLDLSKNCQSLSNIGF